MQRKHVIIETAGLSEWFPACGLRK